MKNSTDNRSSKSLYNSYAAGKIIWFVKRYGLSQLFMKPLRIILGPLIIRFTPDRKFYFKGKAYHCFYHTHNATWANERQVEIALIEDEIARNTGRMLEIGRVMPHYFNVKWDVLDKFEEGERVMNDDVASFSPDARYDFIFSISTFEHIGYDDGYAGDSGEKIMKAYRNVVDNCLGNGGRLVMTVPVGYNPSMDKLIAGGKFEFNSEGYLKRGEESIWKEVSKEEALSSQYGKPFAYANAVLIGECIKK